MTTDRSRRRPYPPLAPAVLLAVLATLLLVGWEGHRPAGTALPAVHVSAPGHGPGTLSLWLPRAQQPDRAGWHGLPTAVLAGGLVLTAGVVSLVRRRQRPAVAPLALISSSPRGPPARVSTY